MPSVRSIVCVCMLTGAVSLLSPLPACAPTARHAQSKTVDTPIARLQALARQQEQSPDRLALALAPPQGVDEAAVAQLPASDLAEGSAATRSLDGVLASLPAPGSIPSVTPQPADEPSRLEAAKAYARARLKLLETKAADAIAELEHAATLDPGSAEIWRELAQAQQLTGRRSAALASLRRSAALGVDNPEVYAILARQAMFDRDNAEAAALSKIALASTRLESDPALTAVIHADLSIALDHLGYLTASATVGESALSVQPQQLAAARLRDEAAELFRRRADHWRRIGQTWCRLGQYARAAAAFEQADASVSLDPGAITPYTVYARLRQGQSAAAALALIAQIRAAQGLVEDRQIPLLALLTRSTRVGDDLGSAILQVADELGTSSPSIQSRLARVVLASSTPQRGRTLAIDYLRTHANDGDVAGALLATYSPTELAARHEAIATLCTANPAQGPMLADLLVATGNGLDEALTVFSRSNTTPRLRFFHARLLQRLGHFDLATGVLASIDPATIHDPAALAVCTDLCVGVGRWDLAERCLSRLDALDVAQAGLWKANALRSLQRFTEAYDTLSRSLDSSNLNTDWLLRAADLAVRVARPEEARAYLQRAIHADPSDERAYQALLELHSPGGALHDDDTAIGVARSLRQAIPTSRVIRGITAQELVARSLYAQAEPVLLSLLDRELESPAVLDLFITAWEQAAAAKDDLASRGVSLLKQRLITRPDSPMLLGALARVLAAQGKAPEAIALLEPILDRHPIPELARLKEHLLREHMNDAPRAASLARARLESGPRTVDAAVELASLRASEGAFDASMEIISTWLPARITLTPDQGARLLSILAALTPERLAALTPNGATGALRLFDLIAGLGITLPPQIHIQRLTLLARATPEQTQRLYDAITQTAHQHPQLAKAALAQVLQFLGTGDDPSPMLRLLGLAANNAQPIDVELLFEWFRQTAIRGDLDDARALVESLSDQARRQALLDQLNLNMAAPHADAASPAEMAYLVGNVMAALNRDDVAIEVYRYVLTLQPGHGWTSNNLGYMLLERGSPLNEVEPLLLDAWKVLPHDANVIDSLAWLRYKQGRLADTLDETGRVVEYGAVTLLKQAVSLIEGTENPTVHDHLGDALWAAGDKDSARRSWEVASRLLAITAANLPRAGSPEDQPDRRKSMEADIARIRKKLADADQGVEPVIAPRGAGKP